jgi:phosphate transport system substrate-binding protein
MRGARGALALGAAIVATLAFIGTAAPAFASTAILGGGSGFAALEIDQWRADTARNPYNLSINYVAQGSSFGRQQFTGGTFDYAASDIQYMQAEVPDLQAKRCHGQPPSAACFVYVPVSAGGLAFMYNLRGGNGPVNLKLTREAACKIFTGAITKWNDPEIVRYNPSLAANGSDITPVIRADGAGESFVFSEFCIAVAPKVWSDFVAQQKASGNAGNLSLEFAAGQPTSVWPQGSWGANPVPVATADGTASYVADPTSGPNTITYVAAGYAKVRNFPTASVQNAAGVFTQPDEDNVTVALGYAHARSNGTFQLAFNGPDPKAYFPSTYSYILAQTTGFDPGKGATLSQFLCYAVSKGQEIAPQLRYARLSSVLVGIAINAIVQIPGSISRGGCFVAGAAPPPPPPAVKGGSGGTTTNTVAPGATNGNTNGGTSGGNSNTAGAATSKQSPAAKAALVKAAAHRAAVQQADAQLARTESIDAALAKAASTQQSAGSGGVSTIWIVVAGLACAMGITWARRKAAA